MTQKRFIRAAAVLVLALSASPLAAMSPLNASAPTAEPGEILDFPTCDGRPLDPWSKWGGAWTDDGKYVAWWPDRGMTGRGIKAFGSGSSPEEARYTEKVGNVAVDILTSRAPKGTTRFQLRYWTGTTFVDEAGPFHAKFFKKSPLRVRIPNAQYDTYYKFQVVALKGNCIAYATTPNSAWVWCSVPLKWVTKTGSGKTATYQTPVCPKMKD